MSERSRFNLKRKISTAVDSKFLASLAKNIKYGGNPAHKRNPGNFRLNPPSSPRPDKSLCDDAGIFRKQEALKCLRAGVRKGMISTRIINGFPKNIWSVSKSGQPLEAILENPINGTYHGYPLQENDPFAKIVLAHWKTYNET